MEPGLLHRTWATTACVANSLLSIFVQHGCLTWPRFALGKDTSLRHSPEMKMYEQHLTLPCFYSPRALTSVKGEGKGGGGRQRTTRQKARRLSLNDHTPSAAGSHLHGSQDSPKVQRQGGPWGHAGLPEESGPPAPTPNTPRDHAKPLTRGIEGTTLELKGPGARSALTLLGCSARLSKPRPHPEMGLEKTGKISSVGGDTTESPQRLLFSRARSAPGPPPPITSHG